MRYVLNNRYPLNFSPAAFSIPLLPSLLDSFSTAPPSLQAPSVVAPSSDRGSPQPMLSATTATATGGGSGCGMGGGRWRAATLLPSPPSPRSGRRGGDRWWRQH